MNLWVTIQNLVVVRIIRIIIRIFLGKKEPPKFECQKLDSKI